MNDEVDRNQRLKYADELDFDQYWVYRSHPGFQGLLYGLFDQHTSFRAETNLAIFRWAASIFTALVFALFALWTAQEAGWFAALLIAGVVVACPWTTILGGNLFWVLGAFYLPLLGLSYLLRTRGANGILSLSTIFAWAYVLLLAKVLLTGFEFITTALLMSSVPLVYYAVLERWRWRESIQRMSALALAMLSALATGLVIVALQIQSLVRLGPGGGIRSSRTCIAWMAATWYSILAPLSWLAVFRQHATNHWTLDQIVWEMPFVFYGAALVGVVFFRRDNGELEGPPTPRMPDSKTAAI